MKNKKRLLNEILRFVVVGIIATLLDYVTHSIVAYFLPVIWPSGLIVAIATICGFLVSVSVNYFLSVIWVFQNVDQEVDVRSFKNKILFVVLSSIGLLIGIGLMVGFEAINHTLWQIDINKWFDDFRVNFLKSLPFWAFSISFALKTSIVLLYNYFSRKLIIFKKPKEEENENNPH